MDISKLTPQQQEELLNTLRKSTAAARKANKVDSTPKVAPSARPPKKVTPRPKPKRKRGKKGVSLTPASEPDKALEQLRRAIGAAWTETAENPSAELVSCESHLCQRINSYHERKWTSRRLGDDNIIVVVKLKDGTEETRRFSRSVFSAEWKRS